jgi:sugar/nucleoside kinase (ribokinase family)
VDLHGLQTSKGKTFRWDGEYKKEDMNSALTLATELGVLASFTPEIAHAHRDTPNIFLANIDPELQMSVLEQAGKPKAKFVACDTMNFWITNKRPELLKVFSRVDCIVINEGEARQLAGEANLIKAAQKIRTWGPEKIIIKKGEHGVLVFDDGKFFALPGYPLETVFDPTGAGDTFAGALMGYLAKTGNVNFENLKKAVAYGAIVASFTVESFSLDRLRKLDTAQIEERLEIFRRVSSF